MEEMKSCPICLGSLKHCNMEDHENMYVITCFKCGCFKISKMTLLKADFTFKLNARAILSHWIRLNQRDNYVEVDNDKITLILNTFTLPLYSEQVNNLHIYLGDNAKKPSESVDGEINSLTSIIGCVDEVDVKYHLEYLKQLGMIYIGNPSTSIPLFEYNFQFFTASLTHLGWSKYYDIKRTSKDSRLAFMAMKYGDETLNGIYENYIIEAVEKTGFEIRKLDDEKRAGSIDDKLRVEIRRSKFLVADLTHDNNGAYWEAGYAEGLGMPVIYICEGDKFKTSKSHFDTNHHLTVLWKNDEEGLKKFADELKATIRATFPAEAKMED
jgi:hypothetical protein